MPKTKNSLLLRVISSLVLLPVIIGVVWFSYLLTAIVLASAVVICLSELYRTYSYGGYRPFIAFGIASALGLLASATLQPLSLGFDPVPLVLALSIVGSLLSALRQNEEHTLVNWALTLAGAVYIGWLFSYIISLRGLTIPLRSGLLSSLGLSPGAAWVFGVMATTWLQDTFAYFVGKRFGRTLMAPSLSPKKTWEGAAGGLLGAIVGAVGSIYVFCLPFSLPQAILFGLIGGVAGPLGDLSESLMKRQVGLKDMGNIIPGHGGLLDRSDSLLFTAPVLYYVILLMF